MSDLESPGRNSKQGRQYLFSTLGLTSLRALPTSHGHMYENRMAEFCRCLYFHISTLREPKQISLRDPLTNFDRKERVFTKIRKAILKRYHI